MFEIKLLGIVVLTHSIQVISAVINNLHTYDGVKSHDIINGDVFFEILEPEELEYTYRLKPAKDFGGSFTSELFKRRKQISMVFTEPRKACSTTLTNAHKLVDNVAFIERGDCSFLTKAINAERAGAIGVIITTDISSKTEDDYFIEMVRDSSRETNIPVAYLLGRNGRMIFNTLHRYGLDRAIIKLPVNLTFTPAELINHPPYDIQ